MGKAVVAEHSAQCPSVHEGIGVAYYAPTSFAPSVESRELCVMTRVARLFFIIAVMAAAGGCSVELAEKEADTKAMGRQLTDAYHSCVRTSSRRSGQQWSTAIWL
jgi:hypothetical protein